MACTVDCISEYGCAYLAQPQEGAVYAPFVKLRFLTPGNKILTVGNASAPPDNHAAIKSFEYGFTVGQTGIGFKVEIIDQGGIMYRRIIDAINKTVKLALDDTKNCSCQFGWIITNCDGSQRVVSNEDTGRSLFFMPSKMQTKFDSGVVKFTFEATSMVGRWADTRLTDNLGSEDNKMPLKQALRRLFMEYHPKVTNVQFKNKDGGELEFGNGDGGSDGPKSVWPMDQQNALAVARKWLSGIRTKDNLGILMLYDPTGPSIVFKEDPDKSRCCGSLSIGTFIANGGNCSPVISFNPDIEWIKIGIPAAGGTPGSSASGDMKQIIKSEKNIERVGPQSGPTVQQHEYMWRIPDDMAKKNTEALASHLEANTKYEVKGGIEAELKLVGRPDLGDPIDLVGKSASIIVINPFHISTQNCSWITTTNCNKILSNKRWLVKAVSHQISNGSYITTLKVMLPQPNEAYNANDPLGGPNCGTEIFANSQSGQPEGG